MKNLQKGLIFIGLAIFLFSLSNCSIFNEITGNCPCIDCDLDDLPEDDNGKYMPFELVLSFPDTADLVGDTSLVVIDELYIKTVVRDVFLDTQNTSSRLTFPLSSITVTRCICNQNIFLIISSIIIGSETNVAEAANADEEIRREGGIFSLNYLVENDNEDIPVGIVDISAELDKENEELNESSSEPIVAILDSGIDASKFSDYSGIFSNSIFEDTVCNIPYEEFGYNFIGLGSPNAQIQDLNGHGTVVSLAYQSRLEAYPGIDWSDQRMLTVRVLDECGNGTIFSTTCGLAYAKKKGADIINCSWGLYFNDIQLQRAISEIPTTTSIICSGGNSSKTLSGNNPNAVHFPSGYGFPYDLAALTISPPVPGTIRDNVYEVLAIDHYLDYPCNLYPVGTQLASYSNKRQGAFAEPASHVQYIIPGNNCPQNEINGTSFAAPAATARAVHFRKYPSPFASAPPNKTDSRNESLFINPFYHCFSRFICK